MARKKLSEKQEIQLRSSREMEIFKHNDMLQKGRHELSLQEQRCVLFAISKIKPEETNVIDFLPKHYYNKLSKNKKMETNTPLRGVCFHFSLPSLR